MIVLAEYIVATVVILAAVAFCLWLCWLALILVLGLIGMVFRVGR